MKAKVRGLDVKGGPREGPLLPQITSRQVIIAATETDPAVYTLLTRVQPGHQDAYKEGAPQKMPSEGILYELSNSHVMEEGVLVPIL